MVNFSNIVCIIFPFVYSYYLFTCFKTVIFSCGLCINSYWFSGVSREIENYLLFLVNTTKKKKDYVVLCYLQGERFR